MGTRCSCPPPAIVLAIPSALLEKEVTIGPAPSHPIMYGMLRICTFGILKAMRFRLLAVHMVKASAPFAFYKTHIFSGHSQNPVLISATNCFVEAGGSESRLCGKTPCKSLSKSLSEGRSLVPWHQAAWVFDPLAWCFSLKSGHRPARTLRVRPERTLTHGFAGDPSFPRYFLLFQKLYIPL